MNNAPNPSFPVPRPALYHRARALLESGRLWKFADTLDGPLGEASAYVLANDSTEPFETRWTGDGGSCECGGGGDGEPCVHLAALLIRLAEHRRNDARFSALREERPAGPEDNDSSRDAFILSWETSLAARNPRLSNHGTDGDPRQTGTAAAPDGSGKPPGAPTMELDPETDLLFFTEPNPVEKKGVLVLGPQADVAAALAARRPYTLVRHPEAVSDAHADFEDIHGRIWSIRPAQVAVREDGSFGPPSPWCSESGEPILPGESDAAALRRALPGILAGDESLRTPTGRPWSVRRAKALRLRFDPLLSAADDDPLYEPVAELLCDERRDDDEAPTSADSGATASTGSGVSADIPAGIPIAGLAEDSSGERSRTVGGTIVVTGEGLLILNPDDGTAAHLQNHGGALWFLRLMLSRRVLSASDLKARVAGKRPIPENILVQVPDLPDALTVLDPVLVLEISGHDEGTDFKPRWRYAGTVIDGRGRGNVILDHSGLRPRPIGLRDREAEDRAFNKAETILSPALAWRRGRYARMSGNGDVPLRIETSLQGALAEFGAPLMDAGIELCLENRPVRRGGALNIQARRHGNALELNAVVRPGDAHPGEQKGRDAGGTGPDADWDGSRKPNAFELSLDEWLEKGGLARTEAAYFTLSGKHLEQLAFLRDHGMGDSGFLSTSPDNLSLIDAVYASLEAEDDDAGELERKRMAYAGLTAAGSPGEMDVLPPPDDFLAELRPYQQQGYAWLHRLWAEGLGGCLADDMGLGKTVQTLAYLARLDADGRLGASLLVGPVVTLGNWEAEVRRFAPGLSVHRYAGPADKRCLPAPGSGVRLIIVSYQTLRNDVEKFLDREWDHIILDEAHYVKNASSRTFKAIRSLRAAHRVSLTGTPLENHLDELWSQMSFLNPGLLGSRVRFNDRYARPMEEDGIDADGPGASGSPNTESAAGSRSPARGPLARLSDTIAPFILRRRKSEVLHDLPPKDESIIRCEMGEEQAAAYDAMRSLSRRQVDGLLSSESPDGSRRSGSRRIEIFTILSKLRLLAIHPPLAGEPFAGIDSGKMDVMDALLEEIMEEDHKILVFSQFLGALDRAEETCRRRNWKFSRLTGSTKDREEPIRQFRDDPDTRIFLLSLKAGGVGINLTAADYVLLLDPWWNPAVEAQAVDRAHRMGQQRPVMVYRLITSGTIEERVLELQQRKKNLIAGVLGDEEAPKLTDTEILDLIE